MDALLARVIDEADARQLPALVAEWTDAPDARRWLARALRIDLALLTERPELAVPCLVRRCGSLGDARESLFLAYPRKAPADAAELRGLVAGWLDDWRPGRRWLRAVRPTQVPVDGGVVEEYRSATAGQLAFARDAAAIGVLGRTGTVAWERSTGRRLADATLVPRRSAWTIGRDATWGKLVLESGAARLTVAHPEHEIARRAIAVDATRVIVELDSIDFDKRHVVIDTPTGRITWSQPGACVDAACHGDRTYVAGDDAVAIRTFAGEHAGGWHAPEVAQLAIAADGTVATRSGSVIRIWDLAAALDTKLAPRPARGWTAAQFSPDGRRLLTGGLLCDGRDGDLVAVLDVDGPGYLEGGPPLPCQRLADHRLVEVGPFGVAVWDSRTGAEQRHRGVRATSSDSAAFDPRGLYFVLVRPGGRLQLFGLPVPNLVAELRIGEVAPGRVGFSPDGELVWWETRTGERGAMPVADPASAGPLAPDERLPEEPDLAATVTDGLLVAGDAAIPIDDDAAVRSRDGLAFASRTSHFVLV